MKLLFSRTFAVALVLVLTATGLWAAGAEEEPAAAADKEMVTDPSTGEMVSAPEYGGTITYGRVSWAEHCDVWYISGWASHNIGLVNEMLGIGNWALDRDIWDWRVLSDQPHGGLERGAGGKLGNARRYHHHLQHPPGRSLA